MANYENLKATINANIKTNGNQEITGQVMNSVLIQMVDEMGGDIGDVSELNTSDKSSLVAAINEAGFPGAAKTALLQLIRKIAYIDAEGESYYNQLYTALFPNVSYIDAVFTQGEAKVYEGDDLSTLKQYLVVTAFYEDGSSIVLPANAYTLSGTLSVGESTITATYGNKTDTFSVLVSDTPREVLFGIFANGYGLAKITASGSQHYRKIYRNATAARATTPLPFENKGYVFTVTDSTKYNLAAYDVQSLEQVTAPPNVGAVDSYAYMGSTKAVAWATQDSVSTPYVWLALKKMDGTAFTAEELADGAAAVFNYTKNN